MAPTVGEINLLLVDGVLNDKVASASTAIGTQYRTNIWWKLLK
jgi:hypothetical protein